jgi:amidase
MSGDFSDLDAVAQAQLVRSGGASPRELVEAAVARAEKSNGELNAIIHPRFERALAEAAGTLPDGPFRGVPVVVKDLNAPMAGEPHHEGMRALRDAGWIAREDGAVVRRLRAAGCVIVGRTNTPELGLTPTTEPAAYGPTRNPWDRARSAGGSSGGSAAAVSARMVAVGHGTDGGGSIRIPASACGLVGLKVSRGRTSGAPNGEEMCGLSVQHVLTRTVRDSAAMLDVLAGPEPGDPYVAPPPRAPYAEAAARAPGPLRVGVRTATPAGLGETHPECVAAVEEAARALESLGHRVEAASPAALDEDDFTLNFAVLVATDAATLLDSWSRALGRAIGADGVEPDTWALAEMGRAISAPQLQAARLALGDYARRMAAWWTDFDVLLTPTLASPPVELGALASPPGEPLAGGLKALAYIPFTPPFNATGQPAISLPVHMTPGALPVGVQLAAAYAREDVLLGLAAQLEEVFRWHDRRPPATAAPAAARP